MTTNPRMTWKGLLTAAGLMAAAGSVLGFGGAWWWFLDLFAHFRIQYFWGLLAIGVWLLAQRKRAWAATFLALSAVNLALILPFYLNAPNPFNHGTAPYRAMLFNVNYGNGKHLKVLDAIRAYDPDVIVLEEIGMTWFNAVNPALAESHPYHVEELRSDNFGIGLWSKRPFAATNILHSQNAAVPSILAEIDGPCGRYAVLATHPVPPITPFYSEYRDAQLAELALLARDTQRPLLFIGDLNATLWCAAFKRLRRDGGLLNASQGRGLFPTWPACFPAFLRIPIDHVLHTPGIEIASRKTGPRVGSDHLPVIVDFHLQPFDKN
ncbi:MAG: endonuclease/exonuclease/phosphatase family protein [Kiritimatiellaeota bacterium]|nr:endonuclease/exonuclease/phosphatase family protein [Kiritimatiellota bacterium]